MEKMIIKYRSLPQGCHGYEIRTEGSIRAYKTYGFKADAINKAKEWQAKNITKREIVDAT